jgi:hypothetical protein
MSLVAITPWLGDLPDVEEPVLRDVFIRWGEPSIAWWSGSVPREFVHLGYIEPSPEEKVYDASGQYAGIWCPEMVQYVVMDREGVDKREELFPRRKHDATRVVKGDMQDKEFWELVSELDWEAGEDPEAVVEPLVVRLSRLPVKKIAGFYAQLCQKLFELDREDLARQIGDGALGGRYFSPDHFVDARCGVIACGQARYDAVMANPADMPKNWEFEALLYVAEEAYSRRTGRKGVEFAAAHDYATFSNKRGWKER